MACFQNEILQWHNRRLLKCFFLAELDNERAKVYKGVALFDSLCLKQLHYKRGLWQPFTLEECVFIIRGVCSQIISFCEGGGGGYERSYQEFLP